MSGTFDSDGWEILDSTDCIEYGDRCDGLVEYRYPLSGTGKSFARCDFHWSERLDAQERISERYSDSDCAPSWFDPTYAGERWSDDY